MDDDVRIIDSGSARPYSICVSDSIDSTQMGTSGSTVFSIISSILSLFDAFKDMCECVLNKQIMDVDMLLCARFSSLVGRVDGSLSSEVIFVVFPTLLFC